MKHQAVLQGEPAPKQLTISLRCLWGLDPKRMELTNEEDRNKIIARTFDAGTHQDKLNVIDYFGLDLIRQALIKSPELNVTTVSLTALWLDLAPEEYAAFRRPTIPDDQYVSF